MATQADLLQVYLELVDLFEEEGQPQMRDRFLLLAADAAHSAGQADEAERLRLRFLEANPHHFIKPYASFGQAATTPSVQTYLANLRKSYPLEAALNLLGTMRKKGPRPSAAREKTLSLGEDDTTFAIPEMKRGPEPEEGETVENVEQTSPLPPWMAGGQAASWQGGAHQEDTDYVPPTLPPQRKPRAMPPAAHGQPPAARPRAAAPPAPAQPARKPVGESSAQPPRSSIPIGSPLAAPRPPREEELAENEEGGGWVAGFLFLLVALTGLGLAGYTLFRPFLP